MRLGVSNDWGSFSAVGLVNDSDEILAGVVFNGYEHPNILAHIAADFITPGFMYAITDYPFNQAKCSRVTGLIKSKNKKSVSFAESWGAELEGKMRNAAVNDDILVYGLLKENSSKWLSSKYQKKMRF